MKMMRQRNSDRLKMLLAVCLIMAACFNLSEIKAQDKNAGPVMPLFQSEEILYLSMEADFKTVFSNTDDSTNFPAKFTLVDNSGQKRTIDIGIRTRGITRRQKNICKFAPLRLSFPKSGVKNTPFEGQKSIKLVTHCDKADFFEQNIMIEYLIYKAYNILTDSSLKVRPAIINYIYSGNQKDTVKKFAFFIEREKNLVERLHAIELESEKLYPNYLDPYQSCLMDMFQYMIGNTDYSVVELHNIFFVDDSTRRFPPIPVPYDFDWSGLVTASYAVPNPVLNTESVTERVYRGFKKDPEIVYQCIHQFNRKQQEIYQLFLNFPLLEENEKKKTIKYLDEFYKIISDDKKVKTEFFDKAREGNEN
jgi:hypothetical protein